MNEIKNALKLIVPLVIVALISAAVISFVFSKTNPMIQERENNDMNLMFDEIFPEMDDFLKVENEEIETYEILDEGQKIGLIKITSEYGYSSDIQVIVGITNDNEIKGIRILSQEETPGLGSLITESKFYDQFNDLSFEQADLKEEGGEIDSVTAATISSKAAIEAVKKARTN